MKIIPLLFTLLTIAVCVPSFAIGEEIKQSSETMIISQNTILFLETERKFDLKDVSLVEAMSYIELAAREHWNRLADAGKIKNSTFRKWKVKCVELNDSLSYSAENVTISAALNELCSTAKTIAVFDENGLTVIPDFIVLDKDQYELLSKRIYIKK